MKKILLIALSSACFILPSSMSAHADSQVFVTPGSTFANDAAATVKKLKEQSLAKSGKIKVGNVNISLVHHHYMEPDQFGILMKIANSVSGCFKLSPLEYEATFIDGNYMDIEVKSFRRTAVKTKNVAYDCNVGSKVVSGLIVVSAKDLKKRKIREIRFSNGTTRDSYKVKILDDSIQLKPESMVAFKAKGLVGADKDRLIHYFSGKGLVALHIPMARKGEDIAQTIRTFAYQHALTPVFEQGGIDTSGKNNVFYFMDPSGNTLNRLNDDGYAELGEIQTSRPYNGSQGRSSLPIPLKVFATRPGTDL